MSGVKAKGWDSWWQTRDKSGWVFITTSKEAGSLKRGCFVAFARGWFLFAITVEGGPRK